MKLQAGKTRVDSVALVTSPASGKYWTSIQKAGDDYIFRTYQPFTVEIDKGDGGACTVSGIAYPCNVIDRQGDLGDREDLIALERSWRSLGMVINLGHERDLAKSEAEATRSWLAADGSWMLTTKITSPEVCKYIRDGSLRAYSIQGAVMKSTHNGGTMPNEYSESLKALAAAKQLRALVDSIPDGNGSMPDWAVRCQRMVEAGDAAGALRAMEQANGAARWQNKVEQAGWQPHVMADAGRQVVPGAYAQIDEQERLQREREIEIREHKRMNASREAAREARGL